MKKVIKVILHGSTFFLLNAVTQLGGIVYFLTIYLKGRFRLKFYQSLPLFITVYLLFTFAITPLIAPIFGRERLPISGDLQPLNFLTCLLNRNYAKPELKKEVLLIAKRMKEAYPNTHINYLDANFPFFDGFPLFPHLSHNDGKKLDLAFCYKDSKTGKSSNNAPSIIGYGIFEKPRSGEIDYPIICDEKGYWQYSLLEKLTSHSREQDFIIDEKRTISLIKLLADSERTSKIFIEPHLKTRWGLSNLDKIRYHGCHAVRHDDHIHIQIR